MQGTASEYSRLYQAGHDQTINEIVLPVQALRPVDQVTAPRHLLNLPGLCGVFVGRAGEMAELDAAIAAPGTVVIQAVHGLGGVGKSTLAVHWAAAHAGEHNPVWWITAHTPAAIETGLAGLAGALQPELTRVLATEALAERAVQWLACHSGWLLVLDNVADSADISALAARLSISTGRLLITSRRSTGWHHLGEPVRLDVLAAEEAVTLLTAITVHGRPTGPGALDGADRLCDELGYLPLAVEQAGGYLAETGLSPHAYLDLLASAPAVMYDQAAEGADAQRTIARICRLTLDRLSATPLAGQLLRILAWYAPAPIPRALLDGAGEPPLVAQAIGRLAAYNMITLGGDSTVSVHRLVQAVARTPDHGDPHRRPSDIDTARDQASLLLIHALPDPGEPDGWTTWRALLRHVTALADHASPDTDTHATAFLLHQTGVFLQAEGAVARAIAYSHRAHASYARVLGADHPDALTAHQNLGGAYWAAGDLRRAIPLLEQNVADFERVLGAEHPFTLAARGNLASAYLAGWSVNGAVSLSKRTLSDSERVLGADHPSTLTARGNLAYAYLAAGSVKKAITLLEWILSDSERVLGADHPATRNSRDDLASAWQRVGVPGRAIPLLEQTLTERERVLGADHPSTLTSRGKLASAYLSARSVGKAISLFEQTLTGRERVLGTSHLDTLLSRNNLAGAYQAAGDLGKAIPLLEQTLTDLDRILGGDHPITKEVRANLAMLR